jgi:hypothetical protein
MFNSLPSTAARATRADRSGRPRGQSRSLTAMPGDEPPAYTWDWGDGRVGLPGTALDRHSGVGESRGH